MSGGVLPLCGMNTHLFLYRPHGNQRDRSLGACLRVRDPRGTGRWRHVSVRAYVPRSDLRVGRGKVSFEAATWMTSAAQTTGNRLTIKAFVRLAVGLGGPRGKAQGPGPDR